MVLVATLIVAGLAVAPAVSAEPESCPATCDQIPATAWIAAADVPLDTVYRWPRLADVAVAQTGTPPRFTFEELCAAPAPANDARGYAVASRATVTHPDPQWQLQAQILHWRGDTGRGGQLATAVFNAATDALRNCQRTAPAQSPSLTTREPTRLSAVLSGPVIVHTYLVAHPESSTVSELTLWAAAPPQPTWPLADDAAVLDALSAPLCTAYLGSCG